MDLQTWRKQQQEGEEMQLPSGLVVKLCRVSLMDMAVRGDVPAPLVAQVNQVMSKGIGDITVESATEYATAINLVVKAAVIDPRVTDEPGEHSVGVGELPIIDRLAIFRECNRYGEALKPFRRELPVTMESA